MLEIVTAAVSNMSVEEALDYSILAQKCYYLKSDDTELPVNWRTVFHWSPSGGWDNLYAMYVNESRKEVVLAIRGTDNLFNLLSDASLIAGAFTGNFQVPPGQQDIQVMANSIHYHLSHEFIDTRRCAGNTAQPCTVCAHSEVLHRATHPMHTVHF